MTEEDLLALVEALTTENERLSSRLDAQRATLDALTKKIDRQETKFLGEISKLTTRLTNYEVMKIKKYYEKEEDVS